MHNTPTAIEQRIFELFGEHGIRPDPITAAVSAEFGITREEAFELAEKVLRDRGTPRSVAVKEAIDRIDAAIPYI